MLEFLQANWSTIALIGVELIVLIVTLCKRLKTVDSPLSRVVSELPTFIKAAEDSLGKGRGSEKLELVLRMARSLLIAFGSKDPDSELEAIRAKVESILSTPQKK